MRCNPVNMISRPIERVCMERKCSDRNITCVKVGSTLAFMAALVTGLAGGFIAGSAVYASVCPGSSCLGLTDVRSLLTEAIPWAGAAAGGLVAPAIVGAAAQLTGHVLRQRPAPQMQPVEEDRESLLGKPYI